MDAGTEGTFAVCAFEFVCIDKDGHTDNEDEKGNRDANPVNNGDVGRGHSCDVYVYYRWRKE